MSQIIYKDPVFYKNHKNNTCINDMAYLPNARMVEPQKELFLSNTRTKNGIKGLCNRLLGNGSVNTLLCRPQ
jgi:hypothetical protein